MNPELAWGLCARGLALIYVIAFWSLRREVLALCGSRGIHPLAPKLAHLRAEMGPWRAAARHPSLLWISSSDRALRFWLAPGMACAALAAAGAASPLCLAAAWLIYLSFDVAIGLTFPWESMLFEAGLMAVLLPPLLPLPALGVTSAPEPLLGLAFNWLLFRVLFGFGKNKFTAEAKDDPVYLRGFLISQPIPSPLGWRAFRLPRALLVASLIGLFVVEMVLPFLIFVPFWPRLVAGAAFCGLMVSIQLMGNFGFFNMLVVVLCLPLLDSRTPTWASLTSPEGAREWLTLGLTAWLFGAGLLHLPFNTWVARGWPEWPVWAALPRPFRALVAVLRATMPFRTVHAYGVFPPQIGPPLKFLPVVEGTLDGTRWSAFEYRYMPSTEFSPPRFVAPHTPRIDHFALYEGVGAGSGNYLGTMFSQGNPYEFTTVSSTDRLLERLLEPDSPVRALFGKTPFEGAPPLRIRMRIYAFTPTTPEEQARTGRYWHKDFVAMHAEARGPDAALWTRLLPSGEQLHPDERWARRRVARIAPLLNARRLDRVAGVLDPGAAAQWQPFWRWIPEAEQACRSGWPAVMELSDRMRASMSAAALHAFDRIRGALATALLERIEPNVLGLASPALDLPSYFHGSLLAQAAILEGEGAVEERLRNPDPLLDSRANDFVDRGLMLLTLLHRDLMVLHARKERMMATLRLPPPPPTRALPGFLRLMPLLAAALPDPDERLPALDRSPNGEWRLDGEFITARRLRV